MHLSALKASDLLDLPKHDGIASVQTAIGHWGETMFPLFSILKREASFAWPPAQFVLLHLKRVRFCFYPAHPVPSLLQHTIHYSANDCCCAMFSLVMFSDKRTF